MTITKTIRLKIKYHSVAILPPPPFRAITIPPFGIFIKNKYEGDYKILNHEMVHWEQYVKMGLFKFYFQYLKQFIIHGYKKMPMEVEARNREDNI